MKLLKELGYQPKKTIRLMFGTDEESGSGDIPLYLEEKRTRFGFSDCKYPVVYGGEGLLIMRSQRPSQMIQVNKLVRL